MKSMMARVGVALLLILPCFAQDKGLKPKEIEEFKKRVAVALYQQDGIAKIKAAVDETCLYDGPGKSGRVEVETSSRLAGQMFISVRIEGEESARYWVRSLAKPVQFPPTTVADPESVNYSSSSESLNGKSACKIELTGLPGQSAPIAVYEGPGSEIERKVLGKAPKRWFSLVVDDETVYFVRVVDPSSAKAQKLGPQSAKDRASAPDEEKELTHEELVARVVARINKYRKAMGLAEVTEDKELSNGCQLHAEYLVTNEGRPEIEGLRMHQEEKHLPGYTPDGEKSGHASNIGYTARRNRIETAIDVQIATFYHRLGFLDPSLRAVGVGIGKYKNGSRNVTVDVHDLDFKRKPAIYPIIYPYPGQGEIPTQFGLGLGEVPEPVMNAERCGFPITVSTTPLGWKPGEAIARLETAQGIVDCWVFTRENPALRDNPKPDVICLLPKARLQSSTNYTVTVKCKQYGHEKTPEWSKTWSFTTVKEEDPNK
jgi:hypothetical protein